MKYLILLVIFFMINGCTSIASSTAALVVALHSQKIEKETRRYTHIERCSILNRPVAFDVAVDIIRNKNVDLRYQNILNPELDNVEPSPPYHVAYAFLEIADKIGDARASKQKEYILKLLDEKQAKEIEDFVNFKYLKSYLTKCFDVPSLYKIKLKDRDLVGAY